MEFSGYVNPYLYILFVLILPFETPRWLLLVFASIQGLSIDLFSNTPGMHMAATVFLAFLRPFVLAGISPRDNYELGTLPLPSFYGFGWFFKYAAVLVIVHHLSFFLIEAMSLSSILWIIIKTVFSSVFTLLIMGITLLFSYQKKRRI
jgi:hypothetical protein